jgi:hypothetical protein
MQTSTTSVHEGLLGQRLWGALADTVAVFVAFVALQRLRCSCCPTEGAAALGPVLLALAIAIVVCIVVAIVVIIVVVIVFIASAIAAAAAAATATVGLSRGPEGKIFITFRRLICFAYTLTPTRF